MVFLPPPSSPDSNGSKLPVEAPPLDPARERQAKKQASKWFLILLITGLLLGAISAFFVVKVLQDLGLTSRPEQPLRLQQ
jgi:hypothetical protein